MSSPFSMQAEMAEIQSMLQAGNLADAAVGCLGLAKRLEDAGQSPLAMKTYEYLLKIAPDHLEASAAIRRLKERLAAVEVSIQQGNAAYAQGDWLQAERLFRQALTQDPNAPHALANLGLTLVQRKQMREARALIERALELHPLNADARNTLGGIQLANGEFSHAAASFQEVVKLKPDYGPGWLNLGHAYRELRDYSQAIGAYERAVARMPQHADACAELSYLLHHVCDWPRAAQADAQLVALLQKGIAANPFFVSLYTPVALHRPNAERWSAQRYPAAQPYAAHHALPADARADGKLRIGYLSSDLQRHATAYLISELFEQHDRTQFEVYAYSCAPDDGSQERQRISRAVDGFRDLSLKDTASAVQSIQADGIDILVDLKGYTLKHRLDVMAERPAPIQMHYLGYPATTGANFIDYFIADAVTVPQGAERYFREAVIRLPGSYQINDRTRPVPPSVSDRAAYGLPEQGIVFCAFNNAYKITPELFAVWMRLLRAVEGSVLWLWEQTPEASVALREAAAAQGVDPARLIAAPSLPQAQHLQRYGAADIFLDTAPVCGHTTASDALWCGLPVVTLAGEHFASRVAASLLHAVGLPELAVPTLAEYETLARDLALDTARRTQLKQHLVQGRASFRLFDAAATTRALEAAYQHAAQQHRAGVAPESF